MAIRMRLGKVKGRSHIFSSTNCQDALWANQFEIGKTRYTAGIICDGCGEGRSSEVGANLAANFLGNKINDLLVNEVPVRVIPNLLFGQLLGMLKTVVTSFTFATASEYVGFVKDNLLFTVIGFVQGPQEIVVFAAGDGVVVINDEIDYRDSGNQPLYPAYHLVSGRYLTIGVSELPTGFDIYHLLTDKLSRLVVATDGWSAEEGLLNQVWGISHPNGLQRKMNVWSRREHRFRDDATIIVLEKIKEEKDGSGDKRQEGPS